MYAIESEDGQGKVFAEQNSSFSELCRAYGNELRLRVPPGESLKDPNYCDVTRNEALLFILIPRGRNRTTVANALRKRFGPKTVLHFQGFPKDNEAHLISPPLSEVAARAHA